MPYWMNYCAWCEEGKEERTLKSNLLLLEGDINLGFHHTIPFHKSSMSTVCNCSFISLLCLSYDRQGMKLTANSGRRGVASSHPENSLGERVIPVLLMCSKMMSYTCLTKILYLRWSLNSNDLLLDLY